MRPGPGQPGGSLHSGHTTCQWVGQVARWPGGGGQVARWPGGSGPEVADD